MSADNWTQCPRCLKALGDEASKLEAKAALMYGEAPLDEFDKARAAATEARDLAQGTEAAITFREDWELGMVDGDEFYVRYSGACRECGFSHRFNHAEKLRP